MVLAIIRAPNWVVLVLHAHHRHPRSVSDQNNHREEDPRLLVRLPKAQQRAISPLNHQLLIQHLLHSTLNVIIRVMMSILVE